jgi:transcriptional regulator with PAS, ATPase and Fis domain
LSEGNAQVVQKLYREIGPDTVMPEMMVQSRGAEQRQEIEVEESLSLEEREIELIKKALTKHRGKRKGAAAELGISERTLYRKIKEHNIT